MTATAGYFYSAVSIFLARFETQLGYKMTKWVKVIEFVDDVSVIGMGRGGYLDDQLYYANAAGI